MLVHTEYSLYAARHPEAAAALRRHAEELHRRLTALIDSATARIGITLTLPANRLARIVLALHDGVVIREVLGGQAGAAPPGTAPPPTWSAPRSSSCCVPPPPTDPPETLFP